MKNNAILDGIYALKYFHNHSMSGQERSFLHGDHYFHLGEGNATESHDDDNDDRK